MRTYNSNGITINYPNAIAFAFNPFIVSVRGKDFDRIEIKSSINGKSITLGYSAYSNACYADLRQLTQSLYDGIDFSPEYDDGIINTNQIMNLAITVQVYSSDTLKAQTSAIFRIIWGALSYGEVYNGFRTAKMWRGLPYVFSVYSEGAGKLIIATDGVMRKVVDMPSVPGVYCLPLDTPAKDYYDVYDFSGTISQATFSNKFDLTFSSSTQGTYTRKMRIYVGDNEYSDGIYLRWIDRHGFWQHYLFRGGNTKAVVSSDGEFMRNNLLAYDQSYGYQGISGRRQSYGREDTREICAPLVDGDTFDMLMDLPTSPVVDMYVDGGWIAVTIKTGTYTKTGEDLQDFICNVVMPEYFLQSL